MNSNIFSWKRFGKVVRHDLGTLPSQYGVMLLVMALLPAALWLLLFACNGFVINEESPAVPPMVRLVLLLWLVILAALLTPARLYRTSNMPKEGIYYAMLPASKLEKYLSMLLFSLVICPLMVLVGMVALDSLLALLPFGPFKESLLSVNPLSDMDVDPYRGLAALRMLRPVSLALIVLLSYVEIVMLFLFGATIFKKYKFLWTLLALWGIRFVSSLVLIPVAIFTVKHADAWTYQLLAWEGAGNIGDLVGYVINTALVVTLLVDALLIWWSGRRMKRMSY